MSNNYYVNPPEQIQANINFQTSQPPQNQFYSQNPQSNYPRIEIETNTPLYTQNQNIVYNQSHSNINSTPINHNLHPNYIPPNQYMQNTNPNFVNPILVQENHIVIVNPDLHSFPVFVNCPRCQFAGLTDVHVTFSFINCCCCFWTSPLAWILFQLVRNKDLNCLDAYHECHRCHSEIGYYYAC